MKYLLRSRLFVAAALLVASAAANASYVVLINVAASENRNGAYAGFYTLTIDSDLIAAMCDDYSTHINVGDSWSANVYSYADIAGGAGKFSPNLVKYSQAGWLFSQAGSASTSDQASIDEAIWKIMDPLAPTPSTLAGQTYLTDATDGSHDAFDFTSYMQVVTPIPPGASQEFLIGPMNNVPVPAAAWLFGSGLLGLAGVARRRSTH